MSGARSRWLLFILVAWIVLGPIGNKILRGARPADLPVDARLAADASCNLQLTVISRR